MGEVKIHRTVQRRYSQGHHQYQITHVGPEKELEKRGRTIIVPILWTEDDTTEDVLQCERDEDRKQRNIEKNTEEECEEVVQIFR